MDEDFFWNKTASKEFAYARTQTEMQFYKNKYLKQLNMKYELETLGETMKEMKHTNEKLHQQLKEQTAVKHNNGYLFITINPASSPKSDMFSENLQKFVKSVIKFINRNFILEAWAVIEQRGTTEAEAGHGYHAHIELRRNLNYRPSDIIKGAKNTFKSYCDIHKPQLLKCQIHGEDFHKDKMEYIAGVKTGEGKDEKQKIDIIFRKKNNLEIIYNAKNVLKEESQ